MESPNRPAVVLCHGLWMMPWAMRLLGARLATQGLDVRYFGYASLGASLRENTGALGRLCEGIHAPRVHWVGHSLGAAIVCEALRRGTVGGDGRVVLLAPPLRQGEAVRSLSRFAPGRAILGSSLREWLSDPLPAWRLPNELGILAGSRPLGLGRLVAPDLAVPNDGAIAVADTRIEGAKEHRVLDLGHTGLLFSREAARLTANFLLAGSFSR